MRPDRRNGCHPLRLLSVSICLPSVAIVFSPFRFTRRRKALECQSSSAYNHSDMAKKAQEEDRFPLLTYIDESVEEAAAGMCLGAMKQWDAGAIHQSRVATRRLKAALDLLRPVLSDEHLTPFSKVSRKLRRRLGPMRIWM